MSLTKFFQSKAFLLVVLSAIIVVAGITFLMKSTGEPADEPAKGNISTQSIPTLKEAKINAETYPTADNYITLGLAYYYADEFRESIAVTEKALKLNPNYAIAYNNIGSAYNELGEWDKAITALSKALELDPYFKLASNNLAVSLAQKKEAK